MVTTPASSCWFGMAGWHVGCKGGRMEFAIALILLAVGVMLERGRHAARPVRVHTTRR